MEIPDFAKRILDKLNDDGYEAYFVGGCVRDAIRGVEPNDYDITTNATPSEIKEVFSQYTTILTGEKHGTVTVVSEKENIEITTYRVDGEYLDSRRPKSVVFTENITEDLARRDFTMNAVAYNGGYVDPFKGKNDIENRIIRTVGDADKRFSEDALRILRALRFAAVFGFEIEEKTKNSIHKNAPLIKNISAERIYTEFSKLIMGKNAEKILLEYADVICVFAPCITKSIGFDQKNKYHVYDVYTHMVKALSYAPYDLKIRLATLFHDVGKPECFTIDESGGHFKGHSEISAKSAKELFDALKIDNETKDTAVMLIREHQRDILPQKKYVKRFLSKFSYEFLDMLLEVKTADTLAHSSLALKNLETIAKIRELRNEIEEDNECIRLKSLDINGNDVKNEGIEDGKEIGFILQKLLESVIDGDVENKKEALIEKIREMK